MIATCRACGRDVEVRAGRLIKHGIYDQSSSICHASHSDYFHAPEVPTFGVGAKGKAPCGHAGEHVTTNMVICGQGCDKPKKRCTHAASLDSYDAARQLFVKSCRDCGAILEIR